MTVWSAILLGLVQGVTEFFPISASAHRSILQNFLRIGTQENPYSDVFLNLGVLAAVVLAFWPDVRSLAKQALQMMHAVKTPQGKRPNGLLRRLNAFLIIGTLPLLFGLIFRESAKTLFENTFFVGFALVATGGLLFWADRNSHGNKDVKNATMADALLVGFAQLLAVLPGISRSGATVGTGLLRGFDRSFALRFGMLLAVPALLGATVLSFVDAASSSVQWQYLPYDLLMCVCAALSGFTAIYFLRRILRRGRLGIFSFYCWGAGLVTLILSLVA